MGALASGLWVGCAGSNADLEDTRDEAICALSRIPGRLDLMPAGPGLLSVRLVTLDRVGALSAMDALRDDQPTGLAKVRVEAPRPMLAVILRVAAGEMVSESGVTLMPHPITLRVSSADHDVPGLETWAHSQGVSLLVDAGASQDGVPSQLLARHGVDLRDAESVEDGLLQGLARAEQVGAAWVIGDLNRPTLRAVSELMRSHGDLVHLVGVEWITRPSTTPSWRRRCPSDE